MELNRFLHGQHVFMQLSVEYIEYTYIVLITFGSGAGIVTKY